MSGSWLSWWPVAWNPLERWRTTSAANYETILESLSKDIERIEALLVDIKTRKRKTIRSMVMSMLSVWIALTAIVWAVVHRYGTSAYAWTGSVAMLSLVLGTPVFTVLLHRLLHFWYSRLERAQENHLISLRRQQRETINDIKRVTDFEHLRRLLDCYDDETKAKKQERRAERSGSSLTRSQTQPRLALKSKSSMPSLSAARSSSDLAAIASKQPNTTGSSLAPPLYSPNGLSSLGPVVDARKVPPPPRGWMDKVADMILGTDPYGATLEEQQYALICRGCLRHNGLVPKNEFEEILSSPFAPKTQPSTLSLTGGGNPGAYTHSFYEHHGTTEEAEQETDESEQEEAEWQAEEAEWQDEMPTNTETGQQELAPGSPMIE
ncbi:hypothetical protein MCUN1_001669 [Malassezia cuniculi]|uniref:Endoplasmic reticulum junction formation protein lunapark n=1 Tax=Malassezia cuniculi TaxID=948313 RepID=A0AAF0ER10_9BASI|nr:hypothetical protein MCUN1_001669 [Malassezia cuniculi]